VGVDVGRVAASWADRAAAEATHRGGDVRWKVVPSRRKLWGREIEVTYHLFRWTAELQAMTSDWDLGRYGVDFKVEKETKP
jgi:hypothetical protein